MFKLLFKQKYSILVFIITVLCAAAQVATSYGFSLIIQATVDKNLRFMVSATIAVMLIYVVLNTLGYFRAIYVEKLIQNFSTSLRKTAIADFKKKLVYNEKHNNGAECIALNTTDIQQFDQYAANCLFAIYSISLVVISTVALLKVNITLFIISLALSLLMMVLPKYFNKAIKTTTKDISKATEDFNKDLENALASSEMLNNFSALNLLDRIVNVGSKNIKNAKVNRMRSIMTLQGINVTLNAGNQIVLIFIAGYFAYKGYIEFAMIFAISGYTGEFFGGLTKVIELYPNFASANELLSKYPEIKEDQSLPRVEKLDKEIVVSNVKYNYPDKTVEFPNLTFEKNKKYLIKGKSGSGKSTLINILNGDLKNYEGSVEWDNRELKQFDIKSAISTMNQKVQLLNLSIKDNIILNKEYNGKLFREVLENCKLVDVIDNLEEKENTILDNKNLALSGGQLQRLGLARSLYHKKDVFIIDEGTANLDSKLADDIEEIILKDKESTVIMITHRNSEKIENLADKVIILGS